MFDSSALLMMKSSLMTRFGVGATTLLEGAKWMIAPCILCFGPGPCSFDGLVRRPKCH